MPTKGTVIDSTEETRTVAMEDGSTRTFSKKRKLQKESSFDKETGVVTTKFFFDSGDIREFTISPSDELYLKFVAHGIEAKLGDACNSKNPETKLMATSAEAVIILDTLAEQIKSGSWNPGRAEGPRRDAASEDAFAAVCNLYGYTKESLETLIQSQIDSGAVKSRNQFLATIAQSADIEAEIRRIVLNRRAAPATDLLAVLTHQ